jgi:hypothetical protein
MRKIVLGLAATAAIATPLALATAANASVTVADNGTGFVGKGDVQTAFNLRNADVQNAINGNKQAFTFSSEQAATQSLTRTVSQAVSQDVTRSTAWDLSCTVNGKNKTFHRDGTRAGTATGTQTGTQSGTQSGALRGSLKSNIASDPRKTGQWTGWNLLGFATGDPQFIVGESSYDAPVFDAPVMGAATLGDVVWGDWVAEPGENPADCLRNDTDNGVPVVTDLVNEVTEGEVVPTGEVSPSGAVETIKEVAGTATPTGPAQVFATYNGVTKAL